MRLSQIERYVLTRTLLSVAAVFALLTAMILLINFVELSRSLGQRSDAGVGDLLGLAVMQAPSVLVVLLPFIFLFGVLSAFVNLNRRSELIAMRAAGVSAWRFILPAAGAAFVVGIAAFTVLDPLVAALDERFEARRERLVSGVDTSGPQPVWLREGTPTSQLVIGAGAHEGPGVRLRQASFYIYQVGPSGEPVFTRRYDAASAELRAGRWVLQDARDATPGSRATRHEVLTIRSSLDPQAALRLLGRETRVSFWRLPGTIARTEEAGFSATAYRLRLHQLIATPLMLAAMSILAAAFSLRLLRLGNLAALAATGVALGFLFFFFNNLCGALARADVLPPFLAGWTPPLLALLSGFTLLCYTEDG